MDKRVMAEVEREYAKAISNIEWYATECMGSNDLRARYMHRYRVTYLTVLTVLKNLDLIPYDEYTNLVKRFKSEYSNYVVIATQND